MGWINGIAIKESSLYFSDKYPYKFENTGKEKVPGDFEKKSIHKLIEDVFEIVPSER